MNVRNILKLSTAAMIALVISASAAFAGTLVPMKVRTAGEVTLRQPLLDPSVPANFGKKFLYMETEAVGNGSMLGKYTINTYGLVHLAIIDGRVATVAEGTWVATAANGDLLTGTFTNIRFPGEEQFYGDSYITGGTGRFAGASGYETTEGFLYADDTFYYEHQGVITSLGSSK